MQQEKNRILAQNAKTAARSQRVGWLLALSTLPLFGIVAAFGIAPPSAGDHIAVATMVENIALPTAAENAARQHNETEALWQADQVRRDDTLAALLDRLNIHDDAARDFLLHAADARALSGQLRPGRSILAKTSPEGKLYSLQYQLSPNAAWVTTLEDDGHYRAEEMPLALETRTLLQSGAIQTSLFGATDDAGIPDNIAIQLADIFSTKIDFHLDLRKGDHFSVLYEAGFYQGELIKSGRVLAAEFTNHGNTYQAALYQGADGETHYYTPEGKSLHNAFLRSPLEFSRISSGFSLARFHPVLQTWRAHKGVDYAAPVGTQIKATADAVVAFVGVQGGYGNVVMLQHAGDIHTVYGHLSRFAPGLHIGQHIGQGDVIGQVGMTGLASGPHLHYEFRVHGEHRDPLTVALPNVAPIPQHQLALFRQQAAPRLAQLALLHGDQTAALD